MAVDRGFPRIHLDRLGDGARLVRESGEDTARVLSVLSKKVFDQGGVGHAMPSEELPQARGGETRQDIPS